MEARGTNDAVDQEPQRRAASFDDCEAHRFCGGRRVAVHVATCPLDEREWCAFQRKPETPLGTDGYVRRRVVERGLDEKDRPPDLFLNRWSATTNLVGGPPRADGFLRLGQCAFLSLEARGPVECIQLLGQTVQFV